MEKKNTSKIFYSILTLSILGFVLSTDLPGLLFGFGLVQLLLLAFIIVFLVFLFQGKQAGWIMALTYFSWKLIFSLSFLLVFYSSLLQNSDANWGGYYSFLMPLPGLIISGIALFILLRKKNRQLFFTKSTFNQDEKPVS